jgi:2',3'-cyclic-nucleotide 2'-phosphodiesterase (5'-nucleotidase family)
MTIGNHEFDFGPEVLADSIGGFTGSDDVFITANLDFSAEPALQALVDAGRIARSAVVETAGRTIGVVGATTTDLRSISSPRGVVIDPDLVSAIQGEVDALTAAGIDIIILSSHLQGVTAELELVPMLRDLDVVIAGGGGELLASGAALLVPGDTPAVVLGESGYPLMRTDSAGREVPVVSTSGDYRYLGRLILGFDAGGNLVEIDAASDPVRVSGVAPDAAEPDPVIQAEVVEPVAEAVAALAATVIGETEVELDGRRSSVRNVETNLGDLIADAFLAAGARLAPAFGVDAPQVALQNGGGIRNDSIIGAGELTELDTFDILPFSNFVSVVEDVPAGQFKEILENAVSRAGFSDGRGFSLVYDPRGAAQALDPATGEVITPGARVRSAALDDGTVIIEDGAVVAGAPAIDVATIDFLARGGDDYPFRGAPFTALGISYQQALLEYIRDDLAGVVPGSAYPAGGAGRIVALCYGDFDGDGSLDFFDFLAFQSAFAAGDLAADCDQDEALDLLDFRCFQEQFAGGCL